MGGGAVGKGAGARRGLWLVRREAVRVWPVGRLGAAWWGLAGVCRARAGLWLPRRYERSCCRSAAPSGAAVDGGRRGATSGAAASEARGMGLLSQQCPEAEQIP
ncbi:hypothetical protein Srufu_061060 [Streptomyces libani subsp. rufus]|nr:hypothetical protein Srufu_061060 [Streptomyces libani subsp. rufus]